jgi:hypothetical protein
MEFTTQLELQSQTTRLMEADADFHLRMNGALTLLGAPFHATLRRLPPFVLLLQTTTPKIFSLSYSHFTRRYWGNPS